MAGSTLAGRRRRLVAASPRLRTGAMAPTNRPKSAAVAVVAALGLICLALTLQTATATGAAAAPWKSRSSAAAAFARIGGRRTDGRADADLERRPFSLARRDALSNVLSTARGGATAALDVDSDDLWSDSEEEEEDTEEVDSEADEESDEDEESEEESEAEAASEDEESEEEAEDESESEDAAPSASASSLPVKLIISTGLSCPLIDQTMEVTASPQRDVASIRNTVSRQMRGRPPVSSVKLLLGNRALRDEEVIGDLVAELEEDEEDDKEDEAEGESEEEEEEDEDDGMVKLRLTLDGVPPVDPKFGTELIERVDGLSTGELLDAYAANGAASHALAMEAAKAEEEGVSSGAKVTTEEDEEEEEEEDEDDEEDVRVAAAPPSPPASLSMRRHALSIRQRMVSTLPEEATKLLEKGPPGSEDDDVEDSLGEGDMALKESIKRRAGRKQMKGGASTHVRRVLQRNMNINWSDTVRNSVLFLFFGYFGGRSALSRALLYLGAPLCFVLQARPARVAFKQLFYALGHPPGIVLSLLPAPQQAIMSLDYEGSMRELYGSGGAGGDGGEEEDEEGGRTLGGGTEEEVEEDEYDEGYDEDDNDGYDIEEEEDDDDESSEELLDDYDGYDDEY